MLATLVRESAVSDKRLLQGEREVGDLGDGARQLGELGQRGIWK